jgi:hypothetical protein
MACSRNLPPNGLPIGAPHDMALAFLQEPGDDFGTYYLSPGTQRRAAALVRSLARSMHEG